MTLPATAGGAPMSLEFSSEAEETNYLTGGLNFTTAYDDNMLSNNADRQGDVSFMVAPFISLKLARPRTGLTLAYAPGFTFYRRFNDHDENDQNLNINFDYRLTQHATLQLNDTFLKTSAFFGQFTNGLGQPGSGGTQSVIPPLADRIANNASAGLTLQTGPNSMIGFRGTSYELRFPSINTNVTGLSDTHSQGAEAFYTLRISGQHWISATYRFERIGVDTNDGRTLTHSALLAYTYSPRHSLSFSLFGGPQYSSISGQSLTPLHAWSPTAGAGFGWQGLHTSFNANFSRQVSDGGGLAATLQATGGDASFRWQWAKSWTMGVGGSYTSNRVLDPSANAAGNGHTLLGYASINHEIGRHLEVSVSYTRAQQRWFNSAPGTNFVTNPVDRNRPQISISYNFSRPLGR